MRAWVVRSGGKKEEDASDLFEALSIVAISVWADVGNLSQIRTQEEMKDKLSPQKQGWTSFQAGVIAGIHHRFVNKIAVGDLIVTPPTKYRGTYRGDVLVGRCLSAYEYLDGLKLAGEEYPHVRKVNWLKRIPRSEFSEKLEKSIIQLTVFEISKHTAEILALLGEA